MKKQREIFIGLCILFLGFLLGIVVAVIVVESDISSNASNDGWLGFLGGIIASFVSSIMAFYILYINRKDAIRGEDIRLRIEEMNLLESDIKEAFSVAKCKEYDVAKSRFLFIVNKIPVQYHGGNFYKYVIETYCALEKTPNSFSIALEADIYREFLKFKKEYIQKG